MNSNDNHHQPQTTPVWEKALENYREDLADDHLQTILDTGSLEELMKDIKILQPFAPQGRKALDSMNRLKPTFKLVNEFSAVMGSCFDAGGVLAPLIWGSIRMVLSLASSTGDTLDEVLDMLEDLSLALPRLSSYKKTAPTDPDLDGSLLEIYTEFICFHARAIQLFRSHKHVVLLRKSWPDLSRDLSRTVQRVKRLSEAIENEVRLTKMRLDDEEYGQVLRLLGSLNTQQQGIKSQKSHYIPLMEDPRFWSREDILSRIDDSLSMEGPRRTPHRSFALYGMGGAGKTQIALRYANACRDKCDSVLWVSAESPISITESFQNIAKTFEIIQPDSEIDDDSVISKVKAWLSATEIQWLLVFDNADDLDVLKDAWPCSSGGSILLTSRDPKAAFGFASDGCQVKPFDVTTGSEALVNIMGLNMTPENKKQVSVITSTFGGLPLALTQVGGFIAQRKIPLPEFLPLYHRNAFIIDAKNTSINYAHPLATVWEKSLSKLPGDAQLLLQILAFLNPDNIHELILKQGALHVQNPILEFVRNEIDFLDAEQILLQMSLIDKSIESGIVCMHKLVQKDVIRRMSPKERQEIFSILVDILAANLPDTYNADVGHQIASWTQCERVISHLETIVTRERDYEIFQSDNQSFAEFLLRCCWYLYERENYSIAQTYLGAAMQYFSSRNSHAYASAIELQGLINLDISRPIIALISFEEAHEIRTKIITDDNKLIAASFVNIGLALTELGKLDQAQENLQKSIDIRLQHNSDRIGNSYSNMASLLLRMGLPDEAKEMLKRCPSLKDFTDETFLKTGNPRFSGDMVLLSRIRLEQRRYDESLSLASKALDFRRNCLGNRLKVCDSLYQVACLSKKGNDSASAIKLLETCIGISEGLPPVEGLRHLARATYKLSQFLKDFGKVQESTGYHDRALALREDIYKLDGDFSHGVTDFESLVPWMLW